jgi:uncharacterized protein YeaC (DUF1315 family)
MSSAAIELPGPGLIDWQAISCNRQDLTDLESHNRTQQELTGNNREYCPVSDSPNNEPRPQSLQALIDSMTPEVYDNLRRAVELGKWDDGNRLSEEQLAHCMQAIILYEARYVAEDQRTGVPPASSCAGAGQAEPDIVRVLGGEPGESQE